MSCVDRLYIGDTGTSIEFEVWDCDDTVDPPAEALVDISSATVMKIAFIKPDGSQEVVDGDHLTDGTDSLLHYVTLVDTLDQEGTWEAIARITMPSGRWYTSEVSFEVETPIADIT